MRNRPQSAFPNALLVLISPFSRALRFLASLLPNPSAGRDTTYEDREPSRNVWPWFLVAAYLLALYASLPVMPRIWNELDSYLGGHGLRVIYTATGALLAIPLAYMAIRGLRSPRTYFVYAAFCIALFGLGTLEDNPGEKIHMLQYVLLGILVYYALGKSRHRAGRSPKRLLFGLFLCIAAGALDELIQYFLPGRSFTWHDVFVNGASAVLTVLVLAHCLPLTRRSVYGGRRTTK